MLAVMYRLSPDVIFDLASETGLHGQLSSNIPHGSNTSKIFILNIDSGLVLSSIVHMQFHLVNIVSVLSQLLVTISVELSLDSLET